MSQLVEIPVRFFCAHAGFRAHKRLDRLLEAAGGRRRPASGGVI
jgi:hypothetical protein